MREGWEQTDATVIPKQERGGGEKKTNGISSGSDKLIKCILQFLKPLDGQFKR